MRFQSLQILQNFKHRLISEIGVTGVPKPIPKTRRRTLPATDTKQSAARVSNTNQRYDTSEGSE
jgi:hypothetical protein